MINQEFKYNNNTLNNCKRCTIQDAVIPENLLVDGKSFCYLGDTLDGDGG